MLLSCFLDEWPPRSTFIFFFFLLTYFKSIGFCCCLSIFSASVGWDCYNHGHYRWLIRLLMSAALTVFKIISILLLLLLVFLLIIIIIMNGSKFDIHLHYISWVDIFKAEILSFLLKYEACRWIVSYQIRRVEINNVWMMMCCVRERERERDARPLIT